MIAAMPTAGPRLNHHAIRALREARGLTLDQVGAEVGVSNVHLYNVESGKRSMSAAKVALLAAALRVPTPALLVLTECEECARRAAS